MKKVFCLVAVVCGVALLGCGTAYHAYRSDMVAGKKLLDTGDYSRAREDFIEAAKAEPAEPASYALAATASYKLNDLPAASRSITEAAKRDRHSDAYIRILGYKALILLRQGREKKVSTPFKPISLRTRRNMHPRTCARCGPCGAPGISIFLFSRTSWTGRSRSMKAICSSFAARATDGSPRGTGPQFPSLPGK